MRPLLTGLLLAALFSVTACSENADLPLAAGTGARPRAAAAERLADPALSAWRSTRGAPLLVADDVGNTVWRLSAAP